MHPTPVVEYHRCIVVTRAERYFVVEFLCTNDGVGGHIELGQTILTHYQQVLRVLHGLDGHGVNDTLKRQKMIALCVMDKEVASTTHCIDILVSRINIDIPEVVTFIPQQCLRLEIIAIANYLHHLAIGGHG